MYGQRRKAHYKLPQHVILINKPLLLGNFTAAGGAMRIVIRETQNSSRDKH